MQQQTTSVKAFEIFVVRVGRGLTGIRLCQAVPMGRLHAVDSEEAIRLFRESHPEFHFHTVRAELAW